MSSYFIISLAAQAVSLLRIALLAVMDGRTLPAFGIPKDTAAFQLRLKKWHAIGFWCHVVISVPTFLSALNYMNKIAPLNVWVVLLSGVLFTCINVLYRRTFFSPIYNKAAGIDTGWLGDEPKTDKWMIKYFGKYGAIKIMWLGIAVIIVCNVILYFLIK